MNIFGIPKTEDERRSAHLAKYGPEYLPPKGTGKLMQDEEPKEVSNMISPGRTVIITTITSFVTGATGFAFSRGMSGQKVPIIPTLFVGFGAGILGGVASLIALHYIKD